MSAPFMQLYVADYLGDTRHLTTEQHGAYLLILMSMWRAGGWLPNDSRKLARLCGCTPSRWAKIQNEVMEFFLPEGDQITNKRLRFELEKASEKSIKRAEAGTRGGLAKSLKDKSVDVANATVLLCHSSESDIRKNIDTNVSSPAKPKSVGDQVFLEAWKAYPSKGRERSKSQAKTLPIWREAVKACGDPNALLAAVRRYVSQDQTHKGECGPPAFDRWLRDGRWEHWLSESQNVVSLSEMSPELAARRRALLLGENNA